MTQLLGPDPKLTEDNESFSIDLSTLWMRALILILEA